MGVLEYLITSMRVFSIAAVIGTAVPRTVGIPYRTARNGRTLQATKRVDITHLTLLYCCKVAYTDDDDPLP